MLTASTIAQSPETLAILKQYCVVRSINDGYFAHEKHITAHLAERPDFCWLFLYTKKGSDETVFVPHDKVKHLLIRDALRVKKYDGREIGPGWQFSLREKDGSWILKVSNNKDYVDVTGYLNDTAAFQRLLKSAGLA